MGDSKNFLYAASLHQIFHNNHDLIHHQINEHTVELQLYSDDEQVLGLILNYRLKHSIQ